MAQSGVTVLQILTPFYCVQTATIIMDGCDSGLSLIRAAGMEGYRCANRTTIELERRWVRHVMT